MFHTNPFGYDLELGTVRFLLRKNLYPVFAASQAQFIIILNAQSGASSLVRILKKVTSTRRALVKRACDGLTSASHSFTPRNF
jgi:hypothetical protein